MTRKPFGSATREGGEDWKNDDVEQLGIMNDATLDCPS